MALTGREARAALPNLGGEPFGERLDVLTRPDAVECSTQLGVISGRAGEAQVVGDRPVEEEPLLRHHDDAIAQTAHRRVAQVVTTERDRPGVRVVEPRDQLRQGRLARTGRPDQSDALTVRDPQRRVTKRRCRGRRIGKGHGINDQIAGGRKIASPGVLINIGFGVENREHLVQGRASRLHRVVELG